MENRSSLRLENKAVISRIALDTDYVSRYVRLDDHRWSSITETTRVREVAGYNSPTEHYLPPGEGTGLIWRMYSVDAGFEERDGGVYVEVKPSCSAATCPRHFDG